MTSETAPGFGVASDAPSSDAPSFIKAKTDRPTWAEVDADAIAANVRALDRHLEHRARMMAVVKAEAYGHGALGAARTALDAGASCLGVATPYEGQLLRAAGIDVPIVLLSPTLPSQAPEIMRYRLTPAVTSLDMIRALADSGASVHVKVNTGMNRSGLMPADVPAFLREALLIPGVGIEGIFSHLAGADEPDRHGAYDQFDRFDGLLRTLKDQGLRPPVAHIANSAAVLDMPEMALDLVRPGLALYGMYPSTYVGRRVALRPALSWKTRLVEKRRLSTGEAVSYAGTWTAPRPTWTALMPVGYADGLRRALSNKGEVLLGGRRCPIIGRVCMDLTVIDCGDQEPHVGDEIVILGEQKGAVISAEDMASWLGTNNYEVTTQITYRVPRWMIRRGVDTATHCTTGDSAGADRHDGKSAPARVKHTHVEHPREETP